jgi:repressor LexA
MDDLTPRQRQVLRFIQDSLDESGLPPTRAEIASALGFKSANAAEDHLRALQRKGVLDLRPGASRGIQLKDSLREQFGLPLIGRVAAGRPILAEENIEARYQIDPELFQPRPHYLLKVRGMSMRDAGIIDGDLLAVQKAKEAKNGQIVVARLGDEVTVKRFKRGRHGIELIPENPDFQTILVSPDDTQFELEGLAVGLIRNNMMM